MSCVTCLGVSVSIFRFTYPQVPPFVVPDSVVGNVKNLAGKVMGDKELEAKGELGRKSNLAFQYCHTCSAPIGQMSDQRSILQLIVSFCCLIRFYACRQCTGHWR